MEESKSTGRLAYLRELFDALFVELFIGRRRFRDRLQVHTTNQGTQYVDHDDLIGLPETKKEAEAFERIVKASAAKRESEDRQGTLAAR